MVYFWVCIGAFLWLGIAGIMAECLNGVVASSGLRRTMVALAPLVAVLAFIAMIGGFCLLVVSELAKSVWRNPSSGPADSSSEVA